MLLRMSFPRTVVFSLCVVGIPVIGGSLLAQVWTLPNWAVLLWSVACLVLLPMVAFAHCLVAQEILSVRLHEHFLEQDLCFGKVRRVRYSAITRVWGGLGPCWTVSSNHQLLAACLPSVLLLDGYTRLQVRLFLEKRVGAHHPLREKWCPERNVSNRAP